MNQKSNNSIPETPEQRAISLGYNSLNEQEKFTNSIAVYLSFLIFTLKSKVLEDKDNKYIETFLRILNIDPYASSSKSPRLFYEQLKGPLRNIEKESLEALMQKNKEDNQEDILFKTRKES